MDTSELDVTTEPQNLVAEMSLTSGQRYYLQNTGRATVWIAERTAAPGADAARHHVKPGAPHYFTVGARGVWVWARSGTVVTVSDA